MRYYQAQDTFVAGLADGTERLVVKGEPLAEKHELVQRDLKGSRTLFRALAEDEPPPAKPQRRSGLPKEG